MVMMVVVVRGALLRASLEGRRRRRDLGMPRVLVRRDEIVHIILVVVPVILGRLAPRLLRIPQPAQLIRLLSLTCLWSTTNPHAGLRMPNHVLLCRSTSVCPASR